MNTEYLTAFRAAPPFFFVSDEMPYAEFLMFSRLLIMLMPYLVLYRLSKWFSLTQGKQSQQKQYLTLAFTIFSQFLIRHTTQDFDLWLSSPRQSGHGFLSLVYARQRRQFIPHGAISFVEIAVVFVDLFDVMSRFVVGALIVVSP